jgi:glucoamylase
MKKRLSCLLISSVIALSACKEQPAKSVSTPSVAPGAPGVTSHWSYAGKTGIGTSYEQYSDGRYQDSGTTGKISKVWYSIAQGILTETMFGLIHEAQIQEAQFYIKGENFLHQEKNDTVSRIEYLDVDAQGRPLSLAYKLVNRDKQNRYEIEKHIFTDPDTNSLMMKVSFRALADGITPYFYVNPHVANTGLGDKAWSETNTWYAADGNTHVTLKTDAPVAKSTVGFEGVSDGLKELASAGKLEHSYTSTGETTGNVAMTLQLPTLNKGQTGEWVFVLGFGNSKDESQMAASKTLDTGYNTVLANFNGAGNAIGWEDYIASLPELAKLTPTTTDNGKLLYASALVLKAQEDKTHAGAVIASLSNPWGDTAPADKAQTGYKAVWPRDFYQVTMAMLALGDKATPKVAFEYLQQVQTSDKTPGYSGAPGWFLQKTHVDGEIEWVGVQLDQTAMPIMLGWRLWKDGVLSDTEILSWYNKMLKPAATFLSDGGTVNIDWLKNKTIVPPKTIQERWEEQTGYSPSTTAAIITGLVAAADIAKLAKDDANAKHYLAAADKYSASVEKTMFTTSGMLNKAPSDGKYFLRITENTDPNDRGLLGVSNAQANVNESQVIDGGFLELVRYGVRSPSNKEVLSTLPEMDDTSLPEELRVRYDFTFPGVEGKFPGWRRYGRDGYGEDVLAGQAYNATGTNSPDARGRVWPIFTGERGQYELAKAASQGKLGTAELQALRGTYVKAMELFANEGYMIPEQVWDGVGGNDTYHYTVGEGTNSATPLAWSHAEYVKLLRSFTDQKIWDKNSSTETRYVKTKH